MAKMSDKLCKAAKKGERELVESLLSEGVSVDSQDSRGNTPIHHAARKGHLEVTKLIITRKARLNALNSKGDTPLHEAVVLNHEEIVELLLTNGADPNIKNRNGLTPFHHAAIIGNANIIKKMIEMGGDVNSKSRNGFTPFLLVSRYKGYHDILKDMVSAGADVNSKTEEGFTAVHGATLAGETETIKLFIANGADINVRWVQIKPDPLFPAIKLPQRIARTPLHMAVDNSDCKLACELAELLLSNGADVKAQDQFGDTPFDSTIHKECRELLRKYGG